MIKQLPHLCHSTISPEIEVHFFILHMSFVPGSLTGLHNVIIEWLGVSNTRKEGILYKCRYGREGIGSDMKQRDTVPRDMKTAQRGSGHRGKEWQPGLKVCRGQVEHWGVKSGHEKWEEHPCHLHKWRQARVQKMFRWPLKSFREPEVSLSLRLLRSPQKLVMSFFPHIYRQTL